MKLWRCVCGNICDETGDGIRARYCLRCETWAKLVDHIAEQLQPEAPARSVIVMRPDGALQVAEILFDNGAGPNSPAEAEALGLRAPRFRPSEAPKA